MEIRLGNRNSLGNGPNSPQNINSVQFKRRQDELLSIIQELQKQNRLLRDKIYQLENTRPLSPNYCYTPPNQVNRPISYVPIQTKMIPSPTPIIKNNNSSQISIQTANRSKSPILSTPNCMNITTRIRQKNERQEKDKGSSKTLNQHQANNISTHFNTRQLTRQRYNSSQINSIEENAQSAKMIKIQSLQIFNNQNQIRNGQESQVIISKNQKANDLMGYFQNNVKHNTEQNSVQKKRRNKNLIQIDRNSKQLTPRTHQNILSQKKKPKIIKNAQNESKISKRVINNKVYI